MKNLEKIKNKYIKDLQNFIKEHNLETDFLEDIEKSISEKLEKIENPKEEDLRKILKEIWTPKEIFKEELNLEDEPKNFWEKINKKSKKVIFLWVFYELWKKTQISANIFRIIFLFLFFVGIFGNSVLFPILFISYFIGFLLLRTGFFRFIFSWLLGFFCVFTIIPAIFLFWFYISNFHIENIYPFMEVSSFLPVWLGIWIFSLVILAIFFFRYAFFWKTFWIKFFLTWTLSFIIAITIWIGVWFDLFSKYFWIEKTEKNFSIEVWNLKELDFKSFITKTNLKIGNQNFQLIQDDLDYRNINFSEDEKIHITLEKNMIWSKNLIEKYKNFIKNYDFNFKDGKFILNIEIDKEKNYPLIPVNFSIKSIKIPKNIVFSAEYWNFQEKEKINKEISFEVFKTCKKYFFDENWKLNCKEKEDFMTKQKN